MNKSQQTLTGTLLAIAVLLGGSLLLSLGLRGCRLDLTEEGLYSLSDGTVQILDSIEEPIHLDLYWSKSTAGDIPQIVAYAQRVREFLEELVRRSNGKLDLDVLDPEPFSEAEDAASAANLAPVPIDNAGNKLTLGLVATNSVDETEVIQFFDPAKESFLEYDLARLLATLNTVDKPKVAVLTSLQIDARFDQQSGRMVPAWQVIEQMRNLYQVQVLAPTATELPADLSALVVIHPKGLSDDLLHAIDQYAIGGGNMLLFLDPHCEADPAARPAGSPFGGGPQPQPTPSDFGPLLTAWGVQLDTTKFIGDQRWAQRVRSTGSSLGQTDFLAWLGIGSDGMSKDDPVTGALDQINLATVGWFEKAEGAEIELEPLVQSSDQAAPIDCARMLNLFDPGSLAEGFSPTGKIYPLAARLTGTLKSAYGEDTGAAGGVFLVADADLLADRNWIVEESMGPISLGWRMIADNGSFVLNALETVAGSQALLGLRGRGIAQRPFDRVQELRRQAEARYLEREQELQMEIQQSQARLNELQREKPGQSSLILSPEQEKELAQLQTAMLEARKELRQVRHSLNQDIESLGRRLMLLNVIGTPLLVAFGAVAWMLFRSSRRRAA